MQAHTGGKARAALTRILLAVLVCLAGAPLAIACSLRQPDYQGYDSEEYVFYGEVVGYTSAWAPDCWPLSWICGRTSGWQVAVLDTVSAPVANLKEVEIYAFGLTPSCDSTSYSRSEVREIPLGARFMVVAKRRRDVHGWGAIELDVTGYRGGWFIPVPRGADVGTLRRGELQYEEGVQDQAAYYRLQFELRKDLARLEQDKTAEGRKRILARMVRAPWYAREPWMQAPQPDRLYIAAVQRYAADEASKQWLLQQRKAFLNGPPAAQ